MAVEINFGSGEVVAEELAEFALNGGEPVGDQVHHAYGHLKDLVVQRALISLPIPVVRNSRTLQPRKGRYESPYFIRIGLDGRLDLDPDLSDWPANAEQEQVYRGRLVLTWYRKPAPWEYFRYAIFWLFKWRMFWATKCIVTNAVVRLKYGPPDWMAIEGKIDPFTMSPNFPGCEAAVSGKVYAHSPYVSQDPPPRSTTYSISRITLQVSLS